MKNHLARVGAIYIFAALWLALAGVHAFLEYATSNWWPHTEVPWAWAWARSTFENLQSEAWQVMLSALIIERVIAKRRWFKASEEE